MTVKNGRSLGIDAGSLYVKVAALDASGALLDSAYAAHKGRPIKALKEILPGFLDGVAFKVGLTGALIDPICRQLGLDSIDLVRAEVAAVKANVPEVRNIIDVGGGSVTLIRLNEKGEFESMERNSLCAAGTGSFLDEQAARLGVSYEEIESFGAVDEPPSIATRCAVFAKSDLIHHQQAGRSKVECWSGLCRGMVSTFLGTLLKGRPLKGLTVMVGGVAQNPEIMRWLKDIYGDRITTFPEARMAGAIGAAMMAADELSPEKLAALVPGEGRGESRALATRPPLELKKSRYPSWEVEESYTDSLANEVRVTRLPAGPAVECYMGIDVGSTSTKLLVSDLEGDVLCDVYRKTGGDPIGATRDLFIALMDLEKKRGLKFEVKGCVTTGSGRKMVGLVIGADDVINEISCHVKGAMHVDPEIDTIFEIGGQDSKYMRTQKGKIKDAAMNYVCAAGTGSFVEEVGRKLGYEVHKIGEAVMGIAPPHTSDRCTVFMDQDVRRLLRAGYTKDEALAAVLYSVVQNYLNKVVARRYYSREKIFFQGATARNPGLVAAFENLLGVEMVVSPYAHVMGSWGAALLAKDMMEKAGKSSTFRGLNLADRKIELYAERCDQCVNNCEITFARIEGVEETPSWGYMCGREPGEKKKNVREFRLFAEREKMLRDIGKVKAKEGAPTVVIPRALSMFTYLPTWRRFLGELGLKVVVSPVTNALIKKLGTEISGGDFCFPVKAALGHGRWAFQEVEADWVFIPHTISNEPNEHTSNSLFCPYVQSYPSLVKTALELHGVDASKLLAPVMDLRWKDKKTVSELYENVGKRLGKTQKEVKKAWEAALESQREYDRRCREEGKKALAEIEKEDKPAVLILGRPYNTCDVGINLGLARKIAERGHTVIPLDFVPFDPSELGQEFSNIYWNYPQRIIHATKTLRGNKRIYPVYFTNFNCGPDSFIETYAERISGDKPLLVLGLDEHDADAGYITRIEAFLDVVENTTGYDDFPGVYFPKDSDEEFKKRVIWIPRMHHVGAEFGAAAFRAMGYDARVLPLETDESFEVGRGLTSGNECLPTVVTIGAMVAKLREMDAKPGEHAFFMATADGPCRFGQYALKHRMILNDLGYKDVPIMSPSALNSYQGLPEALRRQVWHLFVASDILMKLRCKVAPYEVNAGETARVLEEEVVRLAGVIEKNGNFDDEWVKSLKRINLIEQTGGPRKPLVGIVGEIYVRCNSFTNDRVIESIESYGGEAWLTPLSEWFIYTAHMQNWRAKEDLRGIVFRGQSLIKNRFILGVEHGLYKKAAAFVDDRKEPPIEEVLEAGKKYLPLNFEGEAILTVGRTVKFIEDGAKMVVNCAPFGCMPGTISGALFQEIQNRTGVPVVSMFYDGEGDLNSLLGIYLAQLGDRGDEGIRGGTQHGGFKEKVKEGEALR